MKSLRGVTGTKRLPDREDGGQIPGEYSLPKALRSCSKFLALMASTWRVQEDEHELHGKERQSSTAPAERGEALML